jgi:hypothetical protein
LCNASRLEASILSLFRSAFFPFSFLMYIRGQEGESVMDEESSHFSQLENCVYFLDKFLMLRQLLQLSKLVLYVWIILWEKDLNQRAVRQ